MHSFTVLQYDPSNTAADYRTGVSLWSNNLYKRYCMYSVPDNNGVLYPPSVLCPDLSDTVDILVPCFSSCLSLFLNSHLFLFFGEHVYHSGEDNSCHTSSLLFCLYFDLVLFFWSLEQKLWRTSFCFSFRILGVSHESFSWERKMFLFLACSLMERSLMQLFGN